MWGEIQRQAEGSMMPFVTYAERVGLEKGIEKGLEQGRQAALQALGFVLKTHFGDAGREFLAELHPQQSLDTSLAMLAAIEAGSSLDDLRKLQPTNGEASG